MKRIFFTGKGGVGKSTLSAATAWQLSQQGHTVLIASIDPAHNLGDIFDVKLHHQTVRVNPHLSLKEIDLEILAKEYLTESKELMQHIYGYLKAFNFDNYFSLLQHSPGTEEYASLIALTHILLEEGKDFEYTIIDTAPTGLTLHILSLPGLVINWLADLIKIRRRILKKRYTIHHMMGKHIPKGIQLNYTESDDPVMQKLQQLRKRYQQLYDVLNDKCTGVITVFNPDMLSLKETVRLIKGLQDLHISVLQGWHNKIIEENRSVVVQVEKEICRQFPDMPLRRVMQQKNEKGFVGYMVRDNLITLLENMQC